MLPFHWGLLGVALFVASTHGASINSAANDGEVEYEYIDDAQRAKRSYKRGQTQSQYLNFGQPELDGKADAEATDSGSRSTVSGTHGMGQAQSQFTSGDCSGCGVGSPVYEYPTGSPDPLTLGGNLSPYSDGKPSSIIGLHGTTPGGSLGPGGAFAPGASGQVGRPGAGGVFAPGAGVSSGQAGQPGVGGGFAPGTAGGGAPGTGGSFAPGTGGLGQLGRPGADGAYAPSGSYIPGTGGGGQIGRPGAGSSYAPGSAYAPGAGQIGGGADGAYGPGQVGRPGIGGGYAPGGSYGPGAGAVGQVGRPGAGGAYPPGSGSAGQVGAPAYAPSGSYAPGSGGAYAPGGTYIPADASQVGRPGAGGAYAPGSAYGPGVSGTGQMGRPGADGGFPIGSGGAGQVGAPGTSFAPSYGTGGVGQQGTPGFGKPAGGGIIQQGQKQPQRPQLIAPPAQLPGHVQGQQTGIGFAPQVPTYGHGPGQQIPPYAQGAGKQQVPQHPVAGQQLPAYGTDGHRPGAAIGQQTPTYGQTGQQIPGTQIMQPGTSFRPGAGFVPGYQQIPQHGSGQPIVGYPQQPGYAPGYGGPTIGGASSLPAAQPGIKYPVTGPQQILQPAPGGLQPGYGTHPSPGYGQPGTGIQAGVVGGYQPGQPRAGTQQGPITPGSGVFQPGAAFGRPGGVPQQGGVPSAGGVVQPGSGFVQPGYGHQGSSQPGGGFMLPEGAQSGTGFGQPGTSGQYVSPQQTGGFVQPGGLQPGSGSWQGGIQPTGGYAQPGLGGQVSTGHIPSGGVIQPGASYGQPGTTIQQGSGIPHGQQGVLVQPGGGLHPGYQPSPGSSGPLGSQPGTGMQQIPTGVQQVAGYTLGLGPQGGAVQMGAGGGYQQGTTFGQTDHGGMRPTAGFGQQGVGVQPSSGPQTPGGFGQQISGPGQQIAAQPGAGFGHYPGAPHIPLPGGGVQQAGGIQPASGLPPGYDSTYGQQPGGQPIAGYGQPVGDSQIGLPGGGAGPQAGYGQTSQTGTVQYGQGPQQIVQPGSTHIPGGIPSSAVQQSSAGLVGGVGGADDAFSQAESSIGNGQAAASALGKKNGGTAKTQVQGTYSSSGSFSASAMTSDNDRSSNSQVTGGVDGAMSQSQGQGGAAQSQAQVQVNEKTGGTKASSQSGGIIQQSQSEVQANDKGGLADAQSSGPGQTSSQAQIGFRPGQDGEIVRSAGGGQASSQSGAHYGNSQSQIQGTSKYGVSYHGAAQSASGTKEQVANYREQNRDLFNTISQFGGTDAVTDRVDTVYNPALTSESDIPDLQLKSSRSNKEVTNTNKLDDDSILPDEDEEEEPYDEYEDEEDYYNENPIKMESKTNGDKKLESSSLYRTHTQTSPTQTQQVAVADPSKKYSVVQKQNGRVQTYPTRTTTETVPNGFRGTVNVEKKFHTKSLETHNSQNKLNITADEKSGHNPRTPDSFVTVTKSITGSMDNSKNPPQDNKNFQSTYYTKSSTCGYFTFSCNIVYGANGRSKICRPKAPTNGKC